MKTKNPFRRFRGVDDKTLALTLGNHADVLRAIGHAVTMLLRERRLILLWLAVETAAVVWLVLR